MKPSLLPRKHLCNADSYERGCVPDDSQFRGDVPDDPQFRGDVPVDSQFRGDVPVDSQFRGEKICIQFQEDSSVICAKGKGAEKQHKKNWRIKRIFGRGVQKIFNTQIELFFIIIDIYNKL